MPKPTQTEEYWRDEFDLTAQDETRLQEWFIQQNQPMTLAQISRQLMEWRVGKAPSAEAGGAAYHPQDLYEVGQRVAFPLLDGLSGEVVGLRRGENPRYGTFQVIQVRFEEGAAPREFAAQMERFEPRGMSADLLPQLSLEELYERYGSYVEESAEWALKRSPNFVTFGAHWLPTLMLVQFHEGHLNIADAMIDVMGEPLPPSELLNEMPTEEQAPAPVKQFSLNHALSQDERFANRGSEEQPRWFLKRLG